MSITDLRYGYSTLLTWFKPAEAVLNLSTENIADLSLKDSGLVARILGYKGDEVSVSSIPVKICFLDLNKFKTGRLFFFF